MKYLILALLIVALPSYAFDVTENTSHMYAPPKMHLTPEEVKPFEAMPVICQVAIWEGHVVNFKLVMIQGHDDYDVMDDRTDRALEVWNSGVLYGVVAKNPLRQFLHVMMGFGVPCAVRMVTYSGGELVPWEQLKDEWHPKSKWGMYYKARKTRFESA